MIDEKKILPLKKNLIQQIKLDEALWQEIKDCSSTLQLKKKEILLKAGDLCNHGYFILKGCLMHSQLNERGEQWVIGFSEDQVYPFLCSLSYFTRQEESYELMALEECEILAFHRDDLERLSYSYPEFGKYYRYIHAQALKNLYRYSGMRLSLHSIEMLEVIKKDYSFLLDRIPDKYIAHFMGISKEWFCKLKKGLQD